MWPELLDWLASQHIKLEPYHGGQTLEGNESSKVLRSLDLLAGVLPTQFSLFLDCLYGLRDTVDSTFGFTLDPFYQDVISRFKVAFSKLREEFIELIGKPLGEFSEQELENSHSAFEHIWDRYRGKGHHQPHLHRELFEGSA